MPNHHPQSEAGQGSLLMYVTGFVLSLALTLVSYALVVNHGLTGSLLMEMLATFAVVQLLVQLVLFLHLGRESKPQWNTIAFAFAAVTVLILVFGSIWIMNHLNYNMMTGPALEKSVIQDEGVHP